MSDTNIATYAHLIKFLREHGFEDLANQVTVAITDVDLQDIFGGSDHLGPLLDATEVWSNTDTELAKALLANRIDLPPLDPEKWDRKYEKGEIFGDSPASYRHSWRNYLLEIIDFRDIHPSTNPFLWRIHDTDKGGQAPYMGEQPTLQDACLRIATECEKIAENSQKGWKI